MLIDIDKEFNQFFSFEGPDKSTVTSVSCKLFAEHILLKLNTIDEQIDTAARLLPPGYMIRICIENGNGYIELETPDGIQDVDNDGCLAEGVLNGINQAVEDFQA